MQVTLCVLVALLLLAVAVPRSARRMAEPTRDPAFDLRLALGELRTAISAYQLDHGSWPGHAPGTLDQGCPLVSAEWLERQLLEATTTAGEPSRRGVTETLHGPYLRGSLPVNPINGLATVRVLCKDEAWPEWALGAAGWLYRPATGEIRADSRGTVSPGGVPYDQL